MPKLKIERSVLAATDPEYLLGRAIGPAYAHVSVCDGHAELALALATLTPGQRHLVAIHWCVVEVCAGGFQQFFSSPACMLSAEALDGFRAVGAHACVDLLGRAIAAVFSEGSVPHDHDERDAALELLDADERRERWKPLEEAFCESLGELDRQMGTYIREHDAEFSET